MKKIIDLWVATYFSIFRKYEQKGMISSLYILQFFWSFNIFSIISYMSPILTKRITLRFLPVAFIILAISIFMGSKIRKWLDKIYFDNWEQIIPISAKIPKTLSILILIVHYVLTVLFFFLCFSCFRFLER